MPPASIRAFAPVSRFVAEMESAPSGASLRPGYVLLGDNAFLYERCRQAVIANLVPPGMRDFALADLDLAETSVFQALDQAQTPSLMAPFQALFLRNLKTLYTRGAKKDEFAALDAYFRSPNPAAVLLLVADHIRLPADLRRMDMQDKERYDRIRETLGDWCSIVELPRLDENDAACWLVEEAERRGALFDPDAARELADALGADLMAAASELDKLLLYTAETAHITLADVETMVLSAKQRSLYELTDAISAQDAARALRLLHGLLNASDAGEDSAIGQLFMLARTFRQMLVIQEKRVRDARGLWTVLWPGFRVAPFAADDLIRQARRYKSPRELTRALRLVARADLELRSSPPDKRLVLERLVLNLANSSRPLPDPS
jgi:DNA polymerase-3 subunit delta